MLTTRVLCAAFVMAAGLAAPISASGQRLGSLKKKACLLYTSDAADE